VFLSRIVLFLLVTATVGSAGALWAKPPAKPGTSTNQTTTTSAPDQPGPTASLPAQAKAYGRYCQNQSKQHVAGQKGTPFSQCVTAMAKAAHGQSPVAACTGMSKKHLAGAAGTPFSRCLVAAAHLKRDQHKPNP
jgi:hypothetical protein